jgi:adenylate cyclase
VLIPSLHLSLRAALISVVLILLVVTAHAIGIITFVNSRSSINELSQTLFNQVSSAAQQRVKGHLEPACHVIEESRSMASLGLLPLDNLELLGQRLAARLRYESSLSELTYGDRDGRFVGTSRLKDGSIEIRRSFIDAEGQATRTRQSVDKSGQSTPVEQRTVVYDPRKRPWYQLASQSQSIVWTAPYRWSNGDTGITCARALRGEQGIRGVFTADFRLNSISRFLKDIQIGKTGQVFLIDKSGALIAGPYARAAELDPRLKKFLTQSVDWKNMPSQKPAYYPMSFNNEDYATIYQFFEIEGNLNWGTVIIVPEDDFLGHVYQTAITTIVIAVIALILAIIAGLFFASQISKPMIMVANDLSRVGQFRIEEGSSTSSFIREITIMNDSVERMKASLKSFSHYVPTELVRALLKDGREATLGGETRELTIHFSDIEGFTGISEGRGARELVADLAEYLEAVGDSLREHEGTIDKFMGDGIIAFFNAPITVEDHAKKSCHSALAAQKYLAEKRRHWRANGQPEFRARIGLHTGEVLVGNIGTKDRFAYTVIGDPVNVASRLEALNKVYGTYIMVSEETWRQAGHDFEWRQLDRVSVVGRAGGLVVYQLLGLRGSLSDSERHARDDYERALRSFQEREFKDAADILELLVEGPFNDKAAELLLSRSQKLIEDAPPESWTGIFKQTSK